MLEPPITMRIRIDWSELDAFGHVNNLAILRYTQTARINLMELLGMMALKSEHGIGPVLASTSCQFRRQLFFPGHVSVQTRIDQVKTTSIHLRHVVLNDQAECVAEMHDVLVMFDFRKNHKHAIPAPLREQLERLRLAEDE